MTDLLTTLLTKLDESTADFTELDSYYAGTQPLAFLSPEAKTALGTRFGRMASQHSPACRHRAGRTAPGDRLLRDGAPDAALWADWIR